MHCSTLMKKYAEERFQFCVWMARIAKKRDIENKEKMERGDKPRQELDIFKKPDHLKCMFGEFIKTPLYTELATLQGYNYGAYCLFAFGNKLYSGNRDRTIRIWNIETYEYIATLRGHTNSVTCITISENKLYSGDGNNTIRIWNTDTQTYSDIDRTYWMRDLSYPLR